MDEAFYRLVRIMGTFDLATGHADSWDELLDSLESELRDVLGHLRAQQCVCGEPKTSGTHRIDGPCYEEQPRAQSPDGGGTLSRERLTDEQLEKMWRDGPYDHGTLYDFKLAARAIEAAHSITGSNKT